MTLAQRLAEARKAVVTIAGVLATLLTAGLLPSPAAHIVSIVLGALTTAGVYVTPNGSRTGNLDPPKR